MDKTQWQISVRGGGDLTGAIVKVTCNMGQAAVERQFEILDCTSDDGETRIYAANEI